MKIKEIKVKCANCGTESEQILTLSNFISGSPNLDLKPNGSMASISSKLQECPNCHYCNYDISHKVEGYNWNENDEFKAIINNKKLSTDARKSMIMHFISDFVGKRSDAYHWAVRTAWALDDMNENKMANEYKMKALQVFSNDILENYLTTMTQASDIMRQVGEFEIASKFAGKVKEILKLDVDSLTDNQKFQIKVLDFLKKLCDKKDSKSHNSKDVK